ncbi:MAG: hypothetical protein II336_18140 [Loktanella sp.]|nr:hypothetical protein [Loktanella sp.]
MSLIAAPAFADAAAVTNCTVLEGGFSTHRIDCDVKNTSSTAIARLNHSIEIFENGRTVPWATIGNDRRPETISVAGGIEPGETLNVTLGYFDIYDDMPMDQLYGEVTVYAPWDVNGDPITAD